MSPAGPPTAPAETELLPSTVAEVQPEQVRNDPVVGTAYPG
jgi:hypothetical protein